MSQAKSENTMQDNELENTPHLHMQQVEFSNSFIYPYKTRLVSPDDIHRLGLDCNTSHIKKNARVVSSTEYTFNDLM